MSETVNQHTTRRGVLFGTVGAMALTAPAVAAGMATHPDAKLIAACERFVQNEARFLRTHYGPTAIADDDERDRAIDAMGVPIGFRNPELKRLCAMRPTTFEGCRALARAALIEDEELSEQDLSGLDSAGQMLLRVIALGLVGPLNGKTEVEAGRLA